MQLVMSAKLETGANWRAGKEHMKLSKVMIRNN